MYLLYTDEANLDPTRSDFFVYAGIAIQSSQAASLSQQIDKLRKKYRYEGSDLLKFNTRERPKSLSINSHREIKREVVKACVEHKVKVFVSLILHCIATSPEDARINEINRICLSFDSFLRRENQYGLVLIDTFPANTLFAILREKFSVGLKGLPYSSAYRLKRVLGIHLASIGTSNFCSTCDIVLGSLRAAVNLRLVPNRVKTAKILLRQLAPLFIRTGHRARVSSLSLFFSPKIIKVQRYLQRYMKLYDFLKDCGIHAAKTPSS